MINKSERAKDILAIPPPKNQENKMSESLPENPDEVEVPDGAPTPNTTDTPPVSDPEAPPEDPSDDTDA